VKSLLSEWARHSQLKSASIPVSNREITLIDTFPYTNIIIALWSKLIAGELSDDLGWSSGIARSAQPERTAFATTTFDGFNFQRKYTPDNHLITYSPNNNYPPTENTTLSPNHITSKMALDAKTEVMQQVRQQAALQNARFLVDVSCNADPPTNSSPPIIPT
jgi:hypothetical protein